MKRHLVIYLSLIMLGFVFMAKLDVSSYSILSDFENDEASYIMDKMQKDIESCFNAANSNNTTLPKLQDSLSSPSFRLLASQKKTQQNLINNILLKRFSLEVPTKNYNTKVSFPLSSKEDLIVIVRHLII